MYLSFYFSLFLSSKWQQQCCETPIEQSARGPVGPSDPPVPRPGPCPRPLSRGCESHAKLGWSGSFGIPPSRRKISAPFECRLVAPQHPSILPCRNGVRSLASYEPPYNAWFSVVFYAAGPGASQLTAPVLGLVSHGINTLGGGGGCISCGRREKHEERTRRENGGKAQRGLPHPSPIQARRRSTGCSSTQPSSPTSTAARASAPRCGIPTRTLDGDSALPPPPAISREQDLPYNREPLVLGHAPCDGTTEAGVGILCLNAPPPYFQ